MTTLMTETGQAPTVAELETGGRWPAAAGGAFAVLVVVGNGLYTEGASQTLGYTIELLGYVALVVFLTWIATTFGAVSRAATTLAVVGGATMVAVKLAGWSAVLASDQAELTPEVSAGLVQVDEAAFALAWLPYGLFVIGLALAAFSSDRLGRAVAWFGVAIGVSCIAAVPASFTEPFVLPWLISLLWLIVASTLLVRGQRGSAASRRDGERTWSVEV